MTALRHAAEWLLERLRLLRPKAELVDLTDVLASRRHRREWERFNDRLRAEFAELDPNPEPPRSA